MAFLAINKDWHGEQSMWIPEAARGRAVVRICREPLDANLSRGKLKSAHSKNPSQGNNERAGEWLRLQPSEVAYLI